jgi:hypothetical protein
MMDQFRGIPLVQLTQLIEVAAANGALVLMKTANNPKNVGKTPHLVLAEQLIASLNRPPEGFLE